MITVSYNIFCRTCFTTDGTRHLWFEMNSNNLNTYRRYTEYKMMSEVEKWRKNNVSFCQCCNSSNIEIEEIQINDYPLYDYDRIIRQLDEKGCQMFQIKIEKRQGNLKLNLGGDRKLDAFLLPNFILEIVSVINKRPDSDYISQSNGDFFIVATGKIDNPSSVQIERYRNAGITRDEIFNLIRPIAEQIGWGGMVGRFLSE